MQIKFTIFLLGCIISVQLNSQDKQPPTLFLSNPAPSLKVGMWIKGDSIKKFTKGKVYVLEFWATWCRPCIAAMPHLSALARKYKDDAVFIGIDIYEKETTSLERIKGFVDSMGSRMDYNVAVDDKNFMIKNWIEAAGEKENGIPKTFVVDKKGTLAWVGHPSMLSEILPRIVNGTWDIQKELANQMENDRLAALDDSLRWDLMKYSGDYEKKDYIGKPDSALLIIAETVQKEPSLKYAPYISFYTFSALLKTKPSMAYEYGKKVIVTPTYEEPAYDFIIAAITKFSDKLTLPPEIYELGAEAYQVEIDNLTYPELVDLSKPYYKMAVWFAKAKNKLKAIEAIQKAIKELKTKKDFAKNTLAGFELLLQQYKDM